MQCSAVLGLLPQVLVQLHDDPPGILHPMSCLIEAVGEQPPTPAAQPPQAAGPPAGSALAAVAAAAGEAAAAGSAAVGPAATAAAAATPAEPAAAAATASEAPQAEPPTVEQLGSGSVVADTPDGAVAVRLTLFASGAPQDSRGVYAGWMDGWIGWRAAWSCRGRLELASMDPQLASQQRLSRSHAGFVGFAAIAVHHFLCCPYPPARPPLNTRIAAGAVATWHEAPADPSLPVASDAAKPPVWECAAGGFTLQFGGTLCPQMDLIAGETNGVWECSCAFYWVWPAVVGRFTATWALIVGEAGGGQAFASTPVCCACRTGHWPWCLLLSRVTRMVGFAVGFAAALLRPCSGLSPSALQPSHASPPLPPHPASPPRSCALPGGSSGPCGFGPSYPHSGCLHPSRPCPASGGTASSSPAGGANAAGAATTSPAGSAFGRSGAAGSRSTIGTPCAAAAGTAGCPVTACGGARSCCSSCCCGCCGGPWSAVAAGRAQERARGSGACPPAGTARPALPRPPAAGAAARFASRDGPAC